MALRVTDLRQDPEAAVPADDGVPAATRVAIDNNDKMSAAKKTDQAKAPQSSSKGGGTATAPARSGKSALGGKEVPPFQWKLLGRSGDYILTLFKSAEREEVEGQLERLQKENYYTDLEIVDINTPIVQPAAVKERQKAEARARRAAKSAAAKAAEAETAPPKRRARKGAARKRTATPKADKPKDDEKPKIEKPKAEKPKPAKPKAVKKAPKSAPRKAMKKKM